MASRSVTLSACRMVLESLAFLGSRLNCLAAYRLDTSLSWVKRRQSNWLAEQAGWSPLFDPEKPFADLNPGTRTVEILCLQVTRASATSTKWPTDVVNML